MDLRQRRPLHWLYTVLSLLALNGCGRNSPAPSAAPQAVPAVVVAVAATDVPSLVEFVGETESSQEVEIRALAELQAQQARLSTAAANLKRVGPLAACVGEPYQRPELDVPAEYRYSISGAANEQDARWWVGFSDPTLDALITEALANNAELLFSQGERDRLLAHVDLYMALGGGWVDEAASQAPQPMEPPGP